MEREAVFYAHGEWVPASKAVVHIFDSGLIYGDTVTETLRTFHRVPYEVEKHLARLRQSLRLARIEVDPGVDFRSLITDLVERNRGTFDPDDELLIKVDVTRGIFDYYREPGVQYQNFNVLLHVLRLPFDRFAQKYETGMSVVYPLTRQIPAQSLDPRVKNRSRMYQAIAEREAADVEAGATALLLDIQGRVAEGTGWNVFMVVDGKLATPSSENCLEGVSRAVTMELCVDLGLPLEERTVWPNDLALADEVFATATSYCMLPITRVQRHAVADGRPGGITTALLDAWSRRAGVDIVAQAKARSRARAVVTA